MAVKHTFVSGKADGADTSLVRPSNWNADHTIENSTITNDMLAGSIALTKLTGDTTTALGVGTLELGHATDTTLSRSSAGVLAVEGVVVPTISSTNTLTNKSLSDSTTFFIDEGDTSKKMQFQLSGITTATTRTLTVPNVNGTIITTGDTGTVTNTMLAGSIALTKLTGDTTTALGIGTVELGHASDTTLSRSSAGVLAVEGVVVPTISSTNTFTNKSLSDSTTWFIDETDGTKKLQFQLSGITTATTRTLTIPNVDGTIVTTGDTGSVTNTMLAGSIANNKLTNSSVTVNGTSIALGASGTITANTTNALTIGTGLSGTSFNGSGAVTIAIDSTVVTKAGTNAFTGANTFTNSTGQTFRQTATQDGIIINGNAAGTLGYAVTITPTTLSGNRTLTLADGNTTLVAGTMVTSSSKLSAFAATTSAELAGVISDETGSGSLVFATSPSLTTPTLGVASATSINKVAFTAPATGSTLTIADGKTLTANNSITIAGTDLTTMTFPSTSTTVAGLGIANAFTGANTFTNSTGQIFRQAANQDGVLIRGRGAGTGNYTAEVIPGTLGGNIVITLPTSTSTLAITGANTFTSKQTLQFDPGLSQHLQVGFDGSNYYTIKVANNGAVTLDAVGSGAKFTFSDAVEVPDDAYASGWNGSTQVPTKNAVYDRLEVMKTESIIIACSDEISALTAGTAKVKFRMPYAFTVTAVRASLSTAQTSGNIFTVDINEAGTSILSTKLTIDNTETSSQTAATAPVISDSSIADDAEISIDIDQIGNGSATGLKVMLIGYKS